MNVHCDIVLPWVGSKPDRPPTSHKRACVQYERQMSVIRNETVRGKTSDHNASYSNIVFCELYGVNVPRGSVTGGASGSNLI